MTSSVRDYTGAPRKLQNLVNSVSMICMAVRQTNPHQAQTVRGQELVIAGAL